MAFTTRTVVSFVFVVVAALLLAAQSAEARALLRAPSAAASVAAAAAISSSTASSSAPAVRHRKMFAAPVASATMAASAPLPADAYVVASPCAPAAAPGTAATAVFTVGSSVNPQVFREVALQVDFPKPLWAGASLTCQTSAGKVITCDKPELSPRDLAESDLVSTACMLGDLAATGAVTCTLSYTVPAASLAGSNVDVRQIVGAITYAPLEANVVEDSMNNAAVTCVSAVA